MTESKGVRLTGRQKAAKVKLITADYVTDGLTIRQISAKRKMAYSTVAAWLREAGVQMRPPGPPRGQKEGTDK